MGPPELLCRSRGQKSQITLLLEPPFGDGRGSSYHFLRSIRPFGSETLPSSHPIPHCRRSLCDGFRVPLSDDFRSDLSGKGSSFSKCASRDPLQPVQRVLLGLSV